MIDGVTYKELTPHGDVRGIFVEMWRQEWLPDGFAPVQGNRADRGAGTVTGFHYHLHQADWWYVSRGRARLVLHDLRAGSSTHGVTMSLDVDPDAGEHRGLYVPPGVAHAFAAITDITLVYLVDQYYNTADELGVAYDDPELAIDWGIASPVVTPRDAGNAALAAQREVRPFR
ncbi:MAG: dTDP-4-dehydrorhamnose 3,5-epimerase [Actinomycetota bacterium]|nr:dTDP-4-dehydrorhamnose 3,5-epimerase [Actinomycetota bacterium]